MSNITTTKEGATMAANIYTIENLLVGNYYRSKTMFGEITYAEKDNRAVWYGDNCQSYLVEILPNSGYNNWGRKTWRTVAVKVGE
jgi:hypothetical protein